MIKTIQVDLDYTLINQNSFYDYVEYVLFNTRNFHKFIWLQLLKLLKRVSFGIFLKDLRVYYISSLKGVLSEDLDKFSSKFVDISTKNFLIIGVLDLVNNYQKKGFKSILYTATIEELAREYARCLHIDNYVSSKLETKNGICTGLLSKDVYNNKKFESNSNNSESIVISDNPEDYTAGVSKFIAVCINERNMEIWKKMERVKILNIYFPLYKKVMLFPPFYYFYSRRPIIDLIFSHIPFFLGFLYITNSMNILSFAMILLSWINYICLYEVGYLINDTKSIRLENVPTKREFIIPPNKFKKALIIRTLLSVILSLLLFIISERFFTYCIYLVLTILIFLIHNSLKNKKIRIITYTLIKPSHLIAPLLIMPTNILVILSVLTFYLPTELFFYMIKVFNLNVWGESLRKIILPIYKFILFTVFIISGFWFNRHALIIFSILGFLLSLKDYLIFSKVFIKSYFKV